MATWDILEKSLSDLSWILNIKPYPSSNISKTEKTFALPEFPKSMPENIGSTSGLSPSEELDIMKLKMCQNDARPNYSYATLITIAIRNSKKGKLTLGELYQWIQDNFPYYKTAGPTWKNSVRHNLSFSKSFVKVPRDINDPGKGSYWALRNPDASVQEMSDTSISALSSKKENRKRKLFPVDDEPVQTFQPHRTTSDTLMHPNNIVNYPVLSSTPDSHNPHQHLSGDASVNGGILMLSTFGSNPPNNGDIAPVTDTTQITSAEIAADVLANLSSSSTHFLRKYVGKDPGKEDQAVITIASSKKFLQQSSIPVEDEEDFDYDRIT